MAEKLEYKFEPGDIVIVFNCENCNITQSETLYNVIESGNAICPDCGDELEIDFVTVAIKP